MKIDEILDKFENDVIFASLLEESAMVDKYHNYIEKARKTAKNRINKLIKTKREKQ